MAKAKIYNDAVAFTSDSLFDVFFPIKTKLVALNGFCKLTLL